MRVLRDRTIPHNSKCRSGERGAAAAKPKAQIILDVLSSVLATEMPSGEGSSPGEEDELVRS